MAVNKHVYLVVLILCLLFGGCMGVTCTTGRKLFGGYNTVVCFYGCCGSWPYQYCCSSATTTTNLAWLIGVIAGGVIGGITFIAIVVALICVCLKQQSHRGRVIQPSTNPQPVQCTTTMASTSTGGQYPMYPAPGTAPVAPYPYPPPGPPPPAYAEPMKQ